LNQPIPFGKYYLLERINVGGMAEVFKAKAFGVEGFERLVAVKRILPNIAEDEEFITMFIDEAKIAVQLQHANIAQIFDLGKVDDSFFIALEFVHGRDLRAIFDFLRKSGERMPAPQACFVVMQVCEGLDYAHNKRDSQGRELNLVHRDVSPQNVLVGYEGEIKLVDFGIAKAAGKASKTQAGILKGKFGYMSPEQVRGLPVDRRSDIFALGIVLYELLTGERLFVGESDFSTLEKVRNVEILPPSSFNKKISPELERIVLKALAKDVEDRYQNAIDLHDDLQAYLYSVGQFYSRKDLGAWMKKTFAAELAEENVKNAQYEQLEEPTPAPAAVAKVAAARTAETGARGGARPPGQALEWDQEELETQIFDRAPDVLRSALEADKEAELTSADIVLQERIEEILDDRTAIAPPPGLMGDGTPEPMAAAAGLAQGDGARPFGGAGPPLGLSAYRQSLTPGSASPFGVGPSAHQPWGQPPSGQGPAVDGAGSAAPAVSPFRQTILGVPQSHLPIPGSVSPGAIPSTSSVPERRPLATFSQQRQQGRKPVVAVVGAVAVVLAAFLVYRYFTRPGKLQILVTPTDAVVAVDDVPLRGLSPVTIEKPPGVYQLSFSREGYLRRDQTVEIQPGQFERLEVQLEASPDTGFELTSDPPGQLVWLDGQPFTGKDPSGPQARTDFKAYPVTPGRHVLEIKGDPRFKPWQYVLMQEPGQHHKIHAQLEPVQGAQGSPEPAPGKALGGAAPAGKPAGAGPSGGAAAAGGPASTKTPDLAPPASPPAGTAAKPAAAPAPQAARPTAPPPRPRPAAPAPKRPAATASSAVAGGGEDCVATIGSKPWAEVWIDGKRVGLTPLIGHKVACGRRKVVLKNSDLGIEKTESITLKAGEPFKKLFQLLGDE
jgi:eukaryotic-like serine/threonine-protein kinase